MVTPILPAYGKSQRLVWERYLQLFAVAQVQLSYQGNLDDPFGVVAGLSVRSNDRQNPVPLDAFDRTRTQQQVLVFVYGNLIRALDAQRMFRVPGCNLRPVRLLTSA